MIANFEWLVFLYYRVFHLNFFSLNHKMYQNYLVFLYFSPLHFNLFYDISVERYVKILLFILKNSIEAIYDLLIYSIALLIFNLVYQFLWWINVTGQFFIKGPAVRREIRPPLQKMIQSVSSLEQLCKIWKIHNLQLQFSY